MIQITGYAAKLGELAMVLPSGLACRHASHLLHYMSEGGVRRQRAADSLSDSAHTFAVGVLQGIVTAILFGAVGTTLVTPFPLTALIPLILAGCALALAYLVLAWRVGLSAFESGLFGSYLPENLRWLVL